MAGLLVAVSLIASLLLVHFSLRREPLPIERPLDVDYGLPLPEVGQASTVFSLTALFGAYLGIQVLLGLPALLGLATGTVLSLLVIRNWIRKRSLATFDEFLASVLGGRGSNPGALGLVLSVTQCGYAASELLILQNISNVGLGLRLTHATLLVVSLGVVAYFYVLLGGYMAVFRTDVLQFALVAAMGIVLFASAARGASAGASVGGLLPRPGYWPAPLLGTGWFLYAYHFLIGCVMGLGLLIASPDAWKRVFQVSSSRRVNKGRFVLFAAAGVAPFAVLIPLGLGHAGIPDGEVNAGTFWGGVLANNMAYVAAALGLIGSFLSSFNGALLASVHVGLVAQRRLRPVPSERSRFHWLMASSLLTLFFLFAALRTFSNPYLLANLLLGPYAAVAGVLVATRGEIQRLRDGSLLWITAVGFVAWLLYFAWAVGLPSVPTTYQINTVPGGVALFVASGLASRIAMIGGARRV